MPTKALNIPEKQLRALYLHKHLSTDAIAKVYRCNHVTILNYLQKYGVPRRSKLGTRKPVRISKAVLFYLYHKKKLTQRQIAEKFGHSRYGIQRWMKIYGILSKPDSETHTKFPKRNFNGDPIEKAYMIGFRLGDLNVYQVHNLIQIRCSTTINNQMLLIKNLFKKYGHVHEWKAKRGTYEIFVLLNKSFSFLLPKNDTVESWIQTDMKCFLSFFAGYSDAEGSILIRKSSHGNHYPYAGFEIQSYDKGILQTSGKILKKLGFIFPTPSISTKAGYDGRGIKRNKDCWRISIYQKESLWRLLHLLKPYMKHRNKLRSLENAKKNIIIRNKLRYAKPINLDVSAII